MSCFDITFNLFDPSGNVVVPSAGDYISLDYQRSRNEVGAFEIILPPYYQSLGIGPDWVFEFYRMTSSGLVIDGGTCWFARTFEEIYDADQCGAVVIGGHDTIGLLRRRIVAWFAPDAPPPGFNGEGFKTAPADDAIREIFQENFGSKVAFPGTPPPSASNPVGFPNPTNYDENDRRMASNRAIIEELPGTGTAPIVAQEIAWQNTLQVMQSFANAAAQQDPKRSVIFDVSYSPSGTGRLGTFEFKVWTGRRGSVRSGLLFSPENGTLSGATYRRDYTEEANWIHVAGPGNGTSRIVAGVVDQERSRSPFYPIEKFVEKADAETNSQEALEGAGQAALNAATLKASLAGDIVQLPGFEFGVDYLYEDAVQAAIRGVTFDSVISNFNVHVEDNECNIEIKFSAERFL